MKEDVKYKDANCMRDTKHYRISVKLVFALFLLCLSACGPNTAAGTRSIDVDADDGTAKMSIYLPEGWVIDDGSFFESAEIANSQNAMNNRSPNNLANSVDQIYGNVYHFSDGSPRVYASYIEAANLSVDSSLPDLLIAFRQRIGFNSRFNTSSPETIEINAKPAVLVRGTTIVGGSPVLDVIQVIVRETNGFSFFEFRAAQGQIAQFEEDILEIVGTVVVER